MDRLLHIDARCSVDRLLGLVDRLPRGGELPFRSEIAEGLSLRIDPDDFGEILANLLDNARKFAAREAIVSTEWVDGHARVLVADDGSGIAPHLRPRLALRGERASYGIR